MSSASSIDHPYSYGSRKRPNSVEQQTPTFVEQELKVKRQIRTDEQNSNADLFYLSRGPVLSKRTSFLVHYHRRQCLYSSHSYKGLMINIIGKGRNVD